MREAERETERWLLEMIDTIVAAGADPSLWPEVIARLAEGWAGIQGVMLLMHNQPTDGQACIGSMQHGFDPDWMRLYEQHYSRINPWVPLIQRQPVLRAGLTNDILPWQSIAETEFYRDFMRYSGECECAAGIKLFDGSDRSAFLAVHYGNRVAARYDSVLAEVLQRLAPAFRAAVALNRELALGPGAGASIPKVLEALALPALIVDERRVIRVANALAASALEGGDMLRLDAAGRLCLGDSVAGKRFGRMVRRLCRTGGAASGDLALRSADGNPTAMLSLFPVGGADAIPEDRWLFPPDRLVLITVRRLGRSLAVAKDTLHQLFGLTEAEARLAARLAEGGSLKEAADALGIAKETARVHLKAIFAKTETHRQAELVTLLGVLGQGG